MTKKLKTPKQILDFVKKQKLIYEDRYQKICPAYNQDDLAREISYAACVSLLEQIREFIEEE